MSKINGCPNNFDDETYTESENLKKCNKCSAFTYEDGILTCTKLYDENRENK